jgi:hypothetical protein
MTLFRLVLLVALVFGGMGCIPSRTPPQLTHTPGPPVTITDSELVTVAFRAQYPDGWRVITAAAAAPPSVILVGPGDTALIVLSAAPIQAPPVPTLPPGQLLRQQHEQISVGEVTIEMYMAGSTRQWAALLRTWAQVRRSLGPPGT